MAIDVVRCKRVYILCIASFALSLLGFIAILLQFKVKTQLGESDTLLFVSLVAFLGFLIVSHVFAGVLAAMNGLSWVHFGLRPLLRPVGGVAFAIFELRAVGKENGWA